MPLASSSSALGYGLRSFLSSTLSPSSRPVHHPRVRLLPARRLFRASQSLAHSNLFHHPRPPLRTPHRRPLRLPPLQQRPSSCQVSIVVD